VPLACLGIARAALGSRLVDLPDGEEGAIGRAHDAPHLAHRRRIELAVDVRVDLLRVLVDGRRPGGIQIDLQRQEGPGISGVEAVPDLDQALIPVRAVDEPLLGEMLRRVADFAGVRRPVGLAGQVPGEAGGNWSCSYSWISNVKSLRRMNSTF